MTPSCPLTKLPNAHQTPWEEGPAPTRPTRPIGIELPSSLLSLSSQILASSPLGAAPALAPLHKLFPVTK